MEKPYGLKYSPSEKKGGTFYDEQKKRPYQINREHITRHKVSVEISDDNISFVKEVMKMVKPKVIMEIGVMRNATRSFTRIFLDEKDKETVYVDIDRMGKGNLDDAEKNIYTLRTDSGDYGKVTVFIKQLGAFPIDLLFIDGYHSIEQVEKDWKYVDLLSDEGVILLHDTNFHDGPAELFEAVDERMFEKKKYFQHEGDWGMAIIKRRKEWKSGKLKNLKAAGSLEISSPVHTKPEKSKSDISGTTKVRSGIGTTIKKPSK